MASPNPNYDLKTPPKKEDKDPYAYLDNPLGTDPNPYAYLDNPLGTDPNQYAYLDLTKEPPVVQEASDIEARDINRSIMGNSMMSGAAGLALIPPVPTTPKTPEELAAIAKIEADRKARGDLKYGARNLLGLGGRGILDTGSLGISGGIVNLVDQGLDTLRKDFAAPQLADLNLKLTELKDKRYAIYDREGPSSPKLAEVDAEIAAHQIDTDAYLLSRKAELDKVNESSWLKPARDTVKEARQAVREIFPVDQDVEASIPGQVVGALGQVVSQIPFAMSGVGIPAVVAQMYDQAFEEALQASQKAGKPEIEALQIARASGLANLPAAAFEQLGNVSKLKTISALFLKNPTQRAAKALIEAMAVEGVTEGIQQGWQNKVAQSYYDPNRELTEGIGTAALVGSLAGGVTAGAGIGLGRVLGSEDPKNLAQQDPSTLFPDQKLKVIEEYRRNYPTLTPSQRLDVDIYDLGRHNTLRDAIANGTPVDIEELSDYNKDATTPIVLPKDWVQDGDSYVPKGYVAPAVVKTPAVVTPAVVTPAAVEAPLAPKTNEELDLDVEYFDSQLASREMTKAEHKKEMAKIKKQRLLAPVVEAAPVVEETPPPAGVETPVAPAPLAATGTPVTPQQSPQDALKEWYKTQGGIEKRVRETMDAWGNESRPITQEWADKLGISKAELGELYRQGGGMGSQAWNSAIYKISRQQTPEKNNLVVHAEVLERISQLRRAIKSSAGGDPQMLDGMAREVASLEAKVVKYEAGKSPPKASPAMPVTATPAPAPVAIATPVVPAVVAAPAPAAPTPISPATVAKKPRRVATTVEDFILPKILRSAKTYYKQSSLDFTSDLDLALYIISSKTPSKQRAAYLEWVQKSTGLTEAQALSEGTKIRTEIAERHNDSPSAPILLPVISTRKNRVRQSLTEDPTHLTLSEDLPAEQWWARFNVQHARNLGFKPDPKDLKIVIDNAPVVDFQAQENSEKQRAIQTRTEAELAVWRNNNPQAPKIIVVFRPDWKVNKRGVRGQYSTDGGIVINAAYALAEKGSTISQVASHEWAHALINSLQGREALQKFATRSIPENQMAALQEKYPRASEESEIEYNLRIVEEWVAKNAETQPAIWQTIVEAVREFLAKAGLVNLSNEETARAMLRVLRSSNSTLSGRESAVTRQSLADRVALLDSVKFRQWFNRSKMVDEDGYPKVFYHGTSVSADFSTFDGRVIFVSPSPEVANYFATVGLGRGSRVFPLYVRAENPFDFRNEDHLNKIRSFVSGNRLSSRISEGSWSALDAIQNEIKEAGFDSYYEMEMGQLNLGVFNPNQLKSAISNTGEYSLKNNNISYSLTDEDLGTSIKRPSDTEVRAEVKATKRITKSLGPKGRDVFARSLEDIKLSIPANERWIGTKLPGQPVRAPDGRRFLEHDLNKKTGPMNLTQAAIDQAWASAIEVTGPAASRALSELQTKGTTMRPPGEAHWKAAENLPNKDRVWYEISAEAMTESFPDFSRDELGKTMDVVAATSPLADPNYNGRLAISILAEDFQKTPSVTPAVVPSSVKDAILGEFGKAEQRKVGSFGGTFRFLEGMSDDPPLTTNDRQVAASMGIPDSAFGTYPVLYELQSRFINNLRDHVNANGGMNWVRFSLISFKLFHGCRPAPKPDLNAALISPKRKLLTAMHMLVPLN